MEWSEYQKTIFQAIEITNDSLEVEAVAGSGKTTTIVEAINRVPRDQTAIFLAFNKSIAEELKRRVKAPNAACMTLHAVGFAAWRNLLGPNSMLCKVDSSKTLGLLKEILTFDERMKLGGLSKLIAYAKGAGIVPQAYLDKPYQSLECHGLTPDEDEVWHDMAEHFDLDVGTYDLEIARTLLALSIEKSRDVIDFDDMLYMPVITGAPFDQYDVVFLDEAQDVNGLQHEMVARLKAPGGRVVAVGDPHQAIYGFRGASHDSMELIRERFECRTLPLSVSYRCPKEVVAEAQRFVSHIQAFDGSPVGEVDRYEYDSKEGHGRVWPIERFKRTDAILCRNSRPLIEIAFLLIRKRIPCKVIGRDIGKNLTNLIEKLKATNLDNLEELLDIWAGKEIVKAKDDEAKIAAIQDKVETLRVFIDEMSPDATVKDLIASIDSLFAEGAGLVGSLTLSTVHKAKGLEWDRVFILDSHFLMPSKWAKQPWQVQQEVNLQYVAATRAKDTLIYVSSDAIRMGAARG